MLNSLPSGTRAIIGAALGLTGIAAWENRGVSEARPRSARCRQSEDGLGLLAEEIDTRNDGLLGNFPQAFSHIGLINAAADIDRVREARET